MRMRASFQQRPTFTLIQHRLQSISTRPSIQRDIASRQHFSELATVGKATIFDAMQMPEGCRDATNGLPSPQRRQIAAYLEVG